ncbi:serine O-acetyltransferase [Sphingomonas gellani]|uniref:serine O-acetyltransferase n=1 Tax=Sphingomonas gellani TaxID=1166340 RepID=A0A1H8DWU4_9SPHN|nr:serine O-acetyltransferase EpsC [Sphingomonas gellani]SEN11779.1 serine O-acetyltransferase [Sphingomonas gellani]
MASTASSLPIADAVEALGIARRAARSQTGRREVERFPSRAAVERVVALLAAALYPRRLGGMRGRVEDEDGFVAAKLLAAASDLEHEVVAELRYWEEERPGVRFEPDHASTVVRLLLASLGEVRRLIDGDIDAAFIGDPAAQSVDEILVAYPGVIAMLHHRLAHVLNELGLPIVARLISAIANTATGIDIHPGATIGEAFFIDHGTGVVIGETAIVGDRVRLYQHVTLGARTPPAVAGVGPRERHARHPVVGDDVVIYAGATILGRVVIGNGATIGGNVWLLDDVAAGAVVVQPAASSLSARHATIVRETLAETGR